MILARVISVNKLCVFKPCMCRSHINTAVVMKILTILLAGQPEDLELFVNCHLLLARILNERSFTLSAASHVYLCLQAMTNLPSLNKFDDLM